MSHYPPLAVPYPGYPAVPSSTTTPPTTTIAANHQPSNPHFRPAASPVSPNPPPNLNTALTYLGRSFEQATRKAESFIENVYYHLRAGGPNLADAAAASLARSAKLLSEGGFGGAFRRIFGPLIPEEFLHAAYACYLSTTSGPVMGTLFISNRRIAFSSDYPLRDDNAYSSRNGRVYNYDSAAGMEWRCYYRIVLMVEEVAAVNQSANRMNPSDKYVQVVTRDGREFWFLGFILYDQALKSLRSAIDLPPAPRAWAVETTLAGG